jgi:hypothetical protein
LLRRRKRGKRETGIIEISRTGGGGEEKSSILDVLEDSFRRITVFARGENIMINWCKL